MLILAINPGSSSTKLGIFDGATAISHEELRHEGSHMADKVDLNEVSFRAAAIRGFLDRSGFVPSSFDAIAARGGLLRPLDGGVYAVNHAMLDDLRTARFGRHASNLGAQLAWEMAVEGQVPAFVVDPVSVDEFWERSRLSGHPDVTRRSLAHTLNIKAVVRRTAESRGLSIERSAFVVAHMGSGTSVAAVLGGRVVDVNNANDEGPFSAERAGGLPVTRLLEWFGRTGVSVSEAAHTVTRRAGLKGYLGTGDVREITHRIEAGDTLAELVLDTMCYQVAKEIGAMHAALGRRPDAILLTGGMAASEWVAGNVSRRVEHLAEVLAWPGECELQALAEGCLRVLSGAEAAIEY